MKKVIADMWIQALTSGEYKQTESAIRINDNFCCLGVLCNIHAQNHPEIAKKQKFKFEYMGYNDFLPPAVVKWAGMKSNDGEYSVNQASLSEWNDHGYSFQEIAQIIRENWQKL